MLGMKQNKHLRYTNRAERAAFIAASYGELLRGDVLDVGCSDAALRSAVAGRYVGVDVAGTPDLVLDLEKQVLPFPDNSFECVVCSDVLEHLDSLHRTFDELVRVSRRYVIVSLPNCRNYEMLFRIWTGKSLKFYGLPARAPEDRHKWFFGYHDAAQFFDERARHLGASVASVRPHMLRYRGLKGWLILGVVRALAITRKRFEDLGSMAIWVVIEKNATK